MPTVYLVPAAADAVEGAVPGDYLLRPSGDDLY